MKERLKKLAPKLAFPIELVEAVGSEQLELFGVDRV